MQNERPIVDETVFINSKMRKTPQGTFEVTFPNHPEMTPVVAETESRAMSEAEEQIRLRFFDNLPQA